MEVAGWGGLLSLSTPRGILLREAAGWRGSGLSSDTQSPRVFLFQLVISSYSTCQDTLH